MFPRLAIFWPSSVDRTTHASPRPPQKRAKRGHLSKHATSDSIYGERKIARVKRSDPQAGFLNGAKCVGQSLTWSYSNCLVVWKTIMTERKVRGLQPYCTGHHCTGQGRQHCWTDDHAAANNGSQFDTALYTQDDAQHRHSPIGDFESGP